MSEEKKKGKKRQRKEDASGKKKKAEAAAAAAAETGVSVILRASDWGEAPEAFVIEDAAIPPDLRKKMAELGLGGCGCGPNKVWGEVEKLLLGKYIMPSSDDDSSSDDEPGDREELWTEKDPHYEKQYLGKYPIVIPPGKMVSRVYFMWD